MDRHVSDKVLHVGPREDNAPEVALSERPVLHNHDSEGLQVEEEDAKIVVEQEETTVNDKEVVHDAPRKRRMRWIWIILFGIVLIAGLPVGLGVGLGRRSRVMLTAMIIQKRGSTFDNQAVVAAD